MDRHAYPVARKVTTVSPPPQVAVIGAGWAGLAAAIQCVQQGYEVTVYDTAGDPGGRARVVERPDGAIDNGQHILIGAYAQTLKLMRTVHVDPEQVLMRRPLSLVDSRGVGLELRKHRHLGDVLAALWRHPTWPLKAKVSLMSHSLQWRRRGFQCDASTTVQVLCQRLAPVVFEELIEPLCLAALNTPAHEASGSLFLQVLKDSVFGPAGACDLLLPCVHLSALLPHPASKWLASRGVRLHYGTRVQSLEREGTQPGPIGAWRVDGEPFDAVVLACTSPEAARLTRSIAPLWSQQAQLLSFETIATAWVQCPGLRLANPMTMLRTGPAQFIFDHGQLGGRLGQLTLVASAANRYDHLSNQELGDLMAKQVVEELLDGQNALPHLRYVLRDRRATWVASAGLTRPSARVAQGLWAAGDYVDGLYPSTLEGAVRSGLAAAQAVLRNDTR